MRSTTRRPRTRRTKRGAIVCALLVALLAPLAVAYVELRGAEGDRSLAGRDSGDAAIARLVEAGEQADPAQRVYPYSVVEGGVRGPEGLQRAVARDPVVAAHFAGFDLSRARVVELGAAKTAYVSYRIKDSVYWTKRRITLAKGETLITDGKSYARARCANRLSDTAQAPTSPAEPSPAVLDTPVGGGPDDEEGVPVAFAEGDPAGSPGGASGTSASGGPAGAGGLSGGGGGGLSGGGGSGVPRGAGSSGPVLPPASAAWVAQGPLDPPPHQSVPPPGFGGSPFPPPGFPGPGPGGSGPPTDWPFPPGGDEPWSPEDPDDPPSPPTAVPGPGTLLLLVSGVLGYAGLRLTRAGRR